MIALLALNVQVIYFTGDVKIHRGKQTLDPIPLMNLKVSDRITTGPLSGILLRLDTGSTVKVGENSDFSIETLTNPPENKASFKLSFGTVLSKVVKGKHRAFMVRTPTGVVGVRGTEFAVSTDGSKTEVYVFEGSVQFETETGQLYLVNSGQYATTTSPPQEIPEEKKKVLSDQLGEEVGKKEKSEEEREKEIKEKIRQALRESIRRSLVEARNAVDEARDLAGEIKRNELSAFRVMRDVHGNIVRVEQRLLRPASNEVVLLNVTRRDDYKYRGILGYVMGFKPGKEGEPRVDIHEARYVGNMDIPMNISEWPAFMANNKENFKFNSITLTARNSFGEAVVWHGEASGEASKPAVWYDIYGNPHEYEGPDQNMLWDFYIIKDDQKYTVVEDNEPVGPKDLLEGDEPFGLDAAQVYDMKSDDKWQNDFPPQVVEFIQAFVDKIDSLPPQFKPYDAMWKVERIPVVARKPDGSFVKLVLYREHYIINPEGEIHTGKGLDALFGSVEKENEEEAEPAEIVAALYNVFSNVAFEEILSIPDLFTSSIDVVLLPDIYIKILQEMIKGMSQVPMEEGGPGPEFMP